MWSAQLVNRKKAWLGVIVLGTLILLWFVRQGQIAQARDELSSIIPQEIVRKHIIGGDYCIEQGDNRDRPTSGNRSWAYADGALMELDAQQALDRCTVELPSVQFRFLALGRKSADVRITAWHGREGDFIGGGMQMDWHLERDAQAWDIAEIGGEMFFEPVPADDSAGGEP